jgi:hypothetical protein
VGFVDPVAISEWNGVVGNRHFQLHGWFINQWPCFYLQPACWYALVACGLWLVACGLWVSWTGGCFMHQRHMETNGCLSCYTGAVFLPSPHRVVETARHIEYNKDNENG